MLMMSAPGTLEFQVSLGYIELVAILGYIARPCLAKSEKQD
jgi:hypothetical protein